MSRVKYGIDNLDVSVIKNGNVVTFVNNEEGEGLKYSYDVIDALTGELVYREAYSVNPCFAYKFESGAYVFIVARVKGDRERSSAVYYHDSAIGGMPEVRLMYVRNGRNYRFTNLTEGEGFLFAYNVYEIKNGKELPVFFSGKNETPVFEYGFMKTREYLVRAFAVGRSGAVSSKIAARIPSGTAESLNGDNEG